MKLKSIHNGKFSARSSVFILPCSEQSQRRTCNRNCCIITLSSVQCHRCLPACPFSRCRETSESDMTRRAAAVPRQTRRAADQTRSLTRSTAAEFRLGTPCQCLGRARRRTRTRPGGLGLSWHPGPACRTQADPSHLTLRLASRAGLARLAPAGPGNRRPLATVTACLWHSLSRAEWPAGGTVRGTAGTVTQ
jgi:hypothetical protein